MRSIIDTISREIRTVLSMIAEEEAAALSDELKRAKRIFVYGEGRSGLMGKAFAMRLMHGGYEVYAVGETIAPSIAANDLLVAISGSGTTGIIYEFAKKARETGARVAHNRSGIANRRDQPSGPCHSGSNEIPPS